jgi:hypothetical protein
MGGVRIGYALFGGPPAISSFGAEDDPSTPDVDEGDDTSDDETISFLPIHAEARFSYWIGKGALAKKGLRPYVFIGGGMAQVDAKVPVTVYDCHDAGAMRQACGEGDDPPLGPEQTTLPQKKLDAWKKLGQGFVSGGGGVVFALKDNMGVQANFNFMYMLGSSGPVLEPSLGFIYGL